MNGAREYAGIFQTGQYGKLYLVCGNHARGRTFHIYVMPSETKHIGMPCTCKEAVEVYGIVSGQPGWTETYGWLHRGKWINDFDRLVADRLASIAEHRRRQQENKKEEALTEKEQTLQLLSNY